MTDNYRFQIRFYELIKFGNLEFLQEFYYSNLCRIDVSAENEQAFSYACEFGKLEIAKWLLQIQPNIDISAENEYAYRYASRNGHLEVVKWLFEIKSDIDICVDNDFAFRNAYRNEHLDVTNWILEKQGKKPITNFSW